MYFALHLISLNAFIQEDHKQIKIITPLENLHRIQNTVGNFTLWNIGFEITCRPLTIQFCKKSYLVNYTKAAF